MYDGNYRNFGRYSIQKVMRILFFGTPEFAVPSLAVLIENGFNVAGVITAPDKPAGRGQKIHFSPVKEYALSKGLSLFQPANLKDKDFLSSMQSLQPDLGIVVAFRMMPVELWSMPKLGTFNLHGSLLPQYRGAAPIQRAVMNGEKITGVTTFFLKHAIDTGNIIFREEIPIMQKENAGELHDRMMQKGAQLVLKTVKAIQEERYTVHEQSDFVKTGEELKPAPKIFKEDCRINFYNNAQSIYNQVRGLSPHPGAFFELRNEDDQSVIAVKILKSSFELTTDAIPRQLLTDQKTFLKIGAADGYLLVEELQWPGKKRMKTNEFLRGFVLGADKKVF